MTDNKAMLCLIENTILKIMESILKIEKLSLKIPLVDWEDLSLSPDGLILNKESYKKTASFQKSPKKFSVFVKLLERSHNLLTNNSYSTKRDVYYEDPKLFGSQKYMDVVLSEMCSFFMTPHWALNFIASSKTLIFGDLTCFNGVDDQFQTFNNCFEGTLLPSAACRLQDFRTRANFLLVIEKDATFQKLLDDGFYKKFKPCILLTTKGYPDLNTRWFLREVYRQLPHLPIYALVDADPFGLDIYASYKYGTKTSVMPTQSTGPLCAPNIELLGILPLDLKELSLPSNDLLSLSKRDRTLLQSFQKRPYYQVDTVFKEQVDYLAHTERKAEIQSLASLGDDYLCTQYLKQKLSDRGFRSSDILNEL